MKWSIIFAIPALYTLSLLGCSSTTTQAGADLSTGEKMSKDEASLLTSIQALEIRSFDMSHDVDHEADEATAADAQEAEAESAVEESAQTNSTASTSTSTRSTQSSTAQSAASTEPASSSSAASSSESTASSSAASESSESSESSASSESTQTTPSSSSIVRAISNRFGPMAASSSKALGVIQRAAAAVSSNESESSSSTESSTATEAEETPAANTAVTTREPATTAEVLRAVNRLRGLTTWTVIPFAHFRRGDRHAVVAWPAINSAGDLVDATVVGICLQETADGELEECSRRWVVRDQAASRAAMVDALGGSDYQVVGRSSGMALDDLGPRLASLGTQFSSAIANGNRSGATQAAVAATRLLPLNRVAYENGIARLLYAAARHEGRLEHVSTVRNGDSATLTFHVRRGIFRLQTITATARPVNGNTDRWIIVSYR